MANFEIKNYNLYLNKAILQIWKIKKYSYKSIARPDYGLLYLLEGNITYTFDNEVIELNEGDIIYLPKGSYYEVDFDIQNNTVKNFLINFDTVNGDDFANSNNPVRVIKDSKKSLFTYFDDLINSYNEKDKPFLINSRFYLCLNSLQLAIQYTKNSKEFLIFEKVSDNLSKNFKMSIKDISDSLHMSQSSFVKNFANFSENLLWNTEPKNVLRKQKCFWKQAIYR